MTAVLEPGAGSQGDPPDDPAAVDGPIAPADASADRPVAPAAATTAPERALRWLQTHPESVTSAAVVGACTLLVLRVFHPSLLLANTTPTGGDLGSHVWAPAYLRDHLLPKWRLSGWAPDWYAGFPAYQFYMVLPALAIVALDVILPYGVAFKLVSVLGAVSLPAAAWAFGKLTDQPFPVPPLLAVATLPYLFWTGYAIWGGNIASTLAGEFSFSLALSLGVVYLGVFVRALRSGRHRALAAALLAAVVLSHLLVAFWVATATVAMVVSHRRVGKAVLRRAGAVIAVAVALSAFWTLPFWGRRHLTIDMGWTKLTAYWANLFPAKLLWAIVLAAFGLLATIRRRDAAFAGLALAAAGLAAAFRWLPQDRLWNARLLPGWYLTLLLLAGLGVAELARLLGDALAGTSPVRLPTRAGAALAIGAFAVAAVHVGLPMGTLWFETHNAKGDPSWFGLSAKSSYLGPWIEQNYRGYERRPAWPEYSSIMRTMIDVGQRDGCGRALWEYDYDRINAYGTPMAMMLLPFWTDSCIASMEGLYFESSATTPFNFLLASEASLKPSRPMTGLTYRDLDLTHGVEHMQLLGIRYYLAFTPEALAQARQRPELTELAVSGPWHVFEVAGSDLVVGLDQLPYVEAGTERSWTTWRDTGVATWDAIGGKRFYAAPRGPVSWPRISAGEDLPTVPVRAAAVSNVRAGDDMISFDVDQPGTPVLVKESYFPNWHVSGASGPYRVTPNFMVVVPNSRHVVLHYGRTTLDLAATALSVVGVVALAALAVQDRRRNRVTPLR